MENYKFKEWDISIKQNGADLKNIALSRQNKHNDMPKRTIDNRKERYISNNRLSYNLTYNGCDFAKTKDLRDILHKNKALFRFVGEILGIDKNKISNMIKK
jgi:uncharacterized protein YigA (DUF484 family)